MSLNNIPDRNLPPKSVEWARTMASRLRQADKDTEQNEQRQRNFQRYAAGQLAVLGRQLNELDNRTTIFQSLSNMSVTGNRTSEPFPRSTQTFSVTAPPGGRTARVEIYGQWTSSSFGNVTVYAYLSYRGQIVSSFVWVDNQVDIENVTQTAHGLAYVTLPPSGVASFEITFIRVGFTSTTTTETLTDVQAYVTPFGVTS